MRSLFFILIFSLLACSPRVIRCSGYDVVEKGAKTFQVEGTLTHSSSYCGGVEPTWEEQQEYYRQKPYGTMIYVRKGGQNSENEKIIDSVQTDANGHFQFYLAPGKYVLFLPNQKSDDIIDEMMKLEGPDITVDKSCLENWWKSGVFQIEVIDSAIVGLKHNFHQECFLPFAIPCIGYHGPYPP